jgi:hypothetical protein
MDLNTAANALRELGHPTRLSIYRSWSGRVMKACRLANCRSTLRFLPPRSAIIFQGLRSNGTKTYAKDIYY